MLGYTTRERIPDMAAREKYHMHTADSFVDVDEKKDTSPLVL